MKKKRFSSANSWIHTSQIVRIIVWIAAILCAVSLLQVVALRYINPPITPNVAWEWVESVLKNRPDKRPAYDFVPIKTISPHLRRAVIAAEDQRFLIHNGFDTREIRQAIKTFFATGKLRGASTISMQAARSVFLLSSRKFYRKLAEVYYTVLIELFWDKDRILEIYLNTVDWGSSVTGAEAAAQKYFNKSAKDLTAAEAALMTAVLPSPHRWSVHRPTPYLKDRQEAIMKAMAKMPLI